MSKIIINKSSLTNVADTIRGKGGTSQQLAFPDDFISAINAIPTSGGGSIPVYYNYPTSGDGAEGDLAIVASSNIDWRDIEYIRMTITANRDNGIGIAMDEIELYDNSDARVEWPTGTTISANLSPYDGHSVEKLIDGNFSDGYLSNGRPSSLSPVIITISLGDSIDFTGIRWYTPWDTPGRDPKDFKFELSQDGNTWNLLSDVTNWPLVQARNTLAYSVGIGSSKVISILTKQQGDWVNPVNVPINNINI